jgi:glycine hydroxymethyltransferase
MIIARSEMPLPKTFKKKLAMSCDVTQDSVIEALDASTIYDVPITFLRQNILKPIAKELDLGELNPDMKEWDELVKKIVQPKIIVCGASAYAREIDFKRFREIADEVGAILFADIAHIAGLVCADEHPSPFPYADVVTTTTHKTLAGPRGGMIMTNDEAIAKKINSAIFPGLQGGPLVHVIAAKAVGFKYNLSNEWKEYAKQVKANTKVLADVLIERGYDLVSNGTDNHLILVSFIGKEFSGKDADAALGAAGITVNKNTVPGERRSPFVTSGIRVGAAALTSRGMKESEFEFIANKMADVLDNIEDSTLHAKIKDEVKELASKFVIYEKAIF